MLFTILISLTALGFLLLVWSFIADKTSWKFISFAMLLVVYFMGWQHFGHSLPVREESEQILDYQFQKTEDFHVVLYIPREHTVYIRDEAEFYAEDGSDKPLLTRNRTYDMYGNIIEEELLVTPLLPDVFVVGTSVQAPRVTPASAVKTVKYAKVTRKSRRPVAIATTHKPKSVVARLVPKQIRVKKPVITYAYVVRDNGEHKRVRITARYKVKRFLRSSIEQIVLITSQGETYAIQYTKGEYTVGRIKTTYDVQKEITYQYEVQMDLAIAEQIKAAK